MNMKNQYPNYYSNTEEGIILDRDYSLEEELSGSAFDYSNNIDRDISPAIGKNYHWVITD